MGVLHRGFIIRVCLDEAVDYPYLSLKLISPTTPTLL